MAEWRGTLVKVNGKYYPIWQQFIDGKDRWIGGILRDEGDRSDPIDMMLGEYPMETEIVDIQLRPNGVDSAVFEIVGKAFSCGFGVRCGGIAGKQVEGWFTFHGFGNHIFRIKEKAT